MPRFARLADPELARFLRAQSTEALTYAPAGATELEELPGFVLDHHRVRLGEGTECFERACTALRSWTMFDLGWVASFPRDAAIAEGTVVAVLARVGPLVWTNACRIVRVYDERGDVRRFGFAYGTLPAHVERGEERFLVEHHAADGAVWYDIRARSRPRPLWAQCMRPWIRSLQKRFARASMDRMRGAVGATGGRP